MFIVLEGKCLIVLKSLEKYFNNWKNNKLHYHSAKSGSLCKVNWKKKCVIKKVLLNASCFARFLILLRQ